MAFQIIRNDITRVSADAIVNTANPKPTYGSGTDQAIYEAAGKEKLLEARKTIGNIAPGRAVETPAFNLDAKYIIHTVGPAWNGGEDGEFEILKNCYENSLQLALDLKCESIAFPLIATGVYGFPKDKALQIAMSVIQPFVMENEMRVILVVFDKKAFELSGNVVENVREYVDANYVEEVTEREYYFGESNIDRPERMVSFEPRMCFSSAEEASVKPSRKERLFSKLRKGSEGRNARNLEIEEEVAEDYECMPLPEVPVSVGVKIDDLLANTEKTFQEKLFEIIDERGLTGPQVYKNYISKQVYSKIQADKYYHPNKYTAIALCLSLHLNIEETQDLIGRAGWTLSPSNKTDLVVKGCIINKEYNIVKIDLILFDHDCPELVKIK